MKKIGNAQTCVLLHFFSSFFSCRCFYSPIFFLLYLRSIVCSLFQRLFFSSFTPTTVFFHYILFRGSYSQLIYTEVLKCVFVLSLNGFNVHVVYVISIVYSSTWETQFGRLASFGKWNIYTFGSVWRSNLAVIFIVFQTFHAFCLLHNRIMIFWKILVLGASKRKHERQEELETSE